MADVIATVASLEDYEFVVGPLGLVDRDHMLTRQAFMQVAASLGRPVYLYEELPYAS